MSAFRSAALGPGCPASTAVGDSTTSSGKGNGITIYGGTLTCSDPGPVVCGNGNPASSSLAQNCYGLDGSLNPLTFPANCGCAAGNCC